MANIAKKYLSLCLALVLCLALCVPAFAAEAAENVNRFYVLNLSDGVWSVRIDLADLNKDWRPQEALPDNGLWVTDSALEMECDGDGAVTFFVAEGRFFPGDTVVVSVNLLPSPTQYDLYLNFSNDSKPQFLSDERARQFGFFDPEQYSVVAPTCSDWAAEDIIAALELGFVPQELQREYTKNITRQEFAQIALSFCGLQYRCYGGVFANLTAKYYGPIEGASSEAFEDCSDSAVRNARSVGLIQGVGDNRFEPDREISRAEAAVMLVNAYRAYTGDLYDENSTLLTDAPELTYTDSDTVADWAQGSAALLAQWGIMNGVGDNEFAPAGFYTREQCIATFMRMWRQAPVSRGKDGASLCSYTWEELLEIKHEEFQTLTPGFYEELPLLENENVIVYRLSRYGLPSGNGVGATILYKTGGQRSLETLIYDYDPLAGYPLPTRYIDISLGEEPNLLLVTISRRADARHVTITVDLDTDRVTSVVVAEDI